mmetsp:Transcript_12364/g.22057  ORF Transcript_12364/g.22057 Transcript_12364/m.22057 type:complete len:289 (+) Transcript_12364:291-1157(+)
MAAFTEEMAPLSEEEALLIASKFLLASPPGQIKEVLKDVQALVPKGVLTDVVLADVFRQYNNQTSQVMGTGEQTIICDEDLAIDNEHYMEFATKKVVCVDHASQTIVDPDVADVEPKEITPLLDEMRTAVEDQVSKYVSSQFLEGTTMVSASGNKGRVIVHLSGEKLNLKNYWSGRWMAKYTIDVVGKRLSGSVKIRVHYFEDGNVQMTTEKLVEEVPLSFTDAKSLGEAAADAIAEEESQIQDSLEEMYVNMSTETFKDMRRVLPVTRQKMDWSGAQLQLAKAFNER